MKERAGEQKGGIDDSRPVFRITPEPTEEELAAIAAAVVALSRSRAARVSNEAPPEDRWRMAARREALRSPLERGKVVS